MSDMDMIDPVDERRRVDEPIPAGPSPTEAASPGAAAPSLNDAIVQAKLTSGPVAGDRAGTRVQRMERAPSVDDTIRRRGRRGAMSETELGPMALDAALLRLDESAEQALEGIDTRSTQITDEESSRAGNRFSSELIASPSVTSQIQKLGGVKKKKGLGAAKAKLGKKSAYDDDVARFGKRADRAIGGVEGQRLSELNQSSDTNTDTQEYQRQLLEQRASKRSMFKQKKVKKGKAPKKTKGGQQPDIKQAGDVSYFLARKDTKKYDKSQKKREETAARELATRIGLDKLASSPVFTSAVGAFSSRIGSVVDATVTPARDHAHNDLRSLLQREHKHATVIHRGIAAGTMTGTDASRQAGLLSQRVDALNGSGGLGYVSRFTQRATQATNQAAESTYESEAPPAVRSFEEKFAQSAKKAKKIAEDPNGKAAQAADQNEQDVAALYTDMRDSISGKNGKDVSAQELRQHAEVVVDVGLNDNLNSVFDKVIAKSVPKPDKAGTRGANMTTSITVKIPLPPPGLLQLEFKTTGSHYPNGDLWAQSRVMIKGGVEPPVAGMKVSALAGLGFYLEAGSKSYEKLGTLMSFALFRRFRESALVPHKLTDHLWGRSAAVGVGSDGAWHDKAGAKYDHANQWGHMVEEQFEENDYAESGGLVSAEAAAELKDPVGVGNKVGFGASLEYQRGKRYTKESIANQRQKHADKHAQGKYKKGDADHTGFGVRERSLATTNNRFTFNAGASVGPFAAGFSASWWGAEKEWWIDGTISATGGDFAGDPAAVAARVATWAGEMAAAGGKIIVQGDQARRDGRDPGMKDAKSHRKLVRNSREMGTTLQGVIQGSWAQNQADWAAAATGPAAAGPSIGGMVEGFNSGRQGASGLLTAGGNDPTGITNALANSPANQTAGQAVGGMQGAMAGGLGISKASTVKILLRGIVRPGDGRESEFQFHVLHEKTKGVDLLGLIQGSQTKDTPIFYAQAPSGEVIWMGGIGRDQVSRAVRHEKHLAQKVAKNPALATRAI